MRGRHLTTTGKGNNMGLLDHLKSLLTPEEHAKHHREYLELKAQFREHFVDIALVRGEEYLSDLFTVAVVSAGSSALVLNEDPEHGFTTAHRVESLKEMMALIGLFRVKYITGTKREEMLKAQLCDAVAFVHHFRYSTNAAEKVIGDVKLESR